MKEWKGSFQMKCHCICVRSLLSNTLLGISLIRNLHAIIAITGTVSANRFWSCPQSPLFPTVTCHSQLINRQPSLRSHEDASRGVSSTNNYPKKKKRAVWKKKGLVSLLSVSTHLNDCRNILCVSSLRQVG